MPESKRVIKLVIDGAERAAEEEVLRAMKDLRDEAEREIDGDVSLTSERTTTIEPEFESGGDV